MHTLLSHEKPKAHGWVLGAWGPKPSLATGDVKAVTMLDEAFHLFTPCLQPDELQNLSGLSSWAQSVLRDTLCPAEAPRAAHRHQRRCRCQRSPVATSAFTFLPSILEASRVKDCPWVEISRKEGKMREWSHNTGAQQAGSAGLGAVRTVFQCPLQCFVSLGSPFPPCP